LIADFGRADHLQSMELSRSNMYYQARPVSERDLRLMRRIDGLHLEAISSQRSF
jgi:hypothetical protein